MKGSYILLPVDGSAHADQAGLLEWYGHFENRPPLVLVHGEASAMQALSEQLQRQYAAEVTIPAYRQKLQL